MVFKGNKVFSGIPLVLMDLSNSKMLKSLA